MPFLVAQLWRSCVRSRWSGIDSCGSHYCNNHVWNGLGSCKKFCQYQLEMSVSAYSSHFCPEMTLWTWLTNKCVDACCACICDPRKLAIQFSLALDLLCWELHVTLLVWQHAMRILSCCCKNILVICCLWVCVVPFPLLDSSWLTSM
jgi:hypothetical protein